MKNMKKKWGKLKLKLNSQPIQYWKNKFDKDNLKKICGGNTATKQKPCKENTVAIYIVFKKKTKATKLSSQPAQYIKNIDKDYLKKKKSQFWVK